MAVKVLQVGKKLPWTVAGPRTGGWEIRLCSVELVRLLRPYLYYCQHDKELPCLWRRACIILCAFHFFASHSRKANNVNCIQNVSQMFKIEWNVKWQCYTMKRGRVKMFRGQEVWRSLFPLLYEVSRIRQLVLFWFTITSERVNALGSR
jgi:hypothetical protein